MRSFSLADERGEGALKVLIWLVILSTIGYIGYQITMVYYERYEVGLAMDSALQNVDVTMSNVEIHAAISNKLREYKLHQQHQAKDFVISRGPSETGNGDRVYLEYRFSRPIGFSVFGLAVSMTLTQKK